MVQHLIPQSDGILAALPFFELLESDGEIQTRQSNVNVLAAGAAGAQRGNLPIGDLLLNRVMAWTTSARAPRLSDTSPKALLWRCLTRWISR